MDPATGDSKLIDLAGGDVCLADGNLLAGWTLYLMQNLAARMAVVSLSQRCGTSPTVSRAGR